MLRRWTSVRAILGLGLSLKPCENERVRLRNQGGTNTRSQINRKWIGGPPPA